MSATGSLQVHAYASRALIPLADVAITITDESGQVIAMRLTDRSGRMAPIVIPVPEKSAGQTPDTGQIPFTSVNLYARLEGYEQIESEGIQIFPGTVTEQNLEMIPLSELPDAWNLSELFRTPAQNL